MKDIFIYIIFSLYIVSCSTEPTQNDPRINFSSENFSFSTGNQMEVALKITDLQTKIFALSLQINFDADLLSFDENTGFINGDFFGEDQINLIKASENLIHLSISLTQGMSTRKGDGTLGTFKFTGIAVGNCELSIDESELVFYDGSGNPLKITNLMVGSSSISVE